MVADLESGKEIDENTELRPQEQKNDCYTKEELLGQDLSGHASTMPSE